MEVKEECSQGGVSKEECGGPGTIVGRPLVGAEQGTRPVGVCGWIAEGEVPLIG